MYLREAKNLLFYWAENATTTEKVSLFGLTIIVLGLTHRMLTYLDTFLERKVKELETKDMTAHPKKKSEEKQRKSEETRDLKVKWWEEYDEDKTVSLDCDFVHLLNQTGIQSIRLATVAIWNFKGKKVYEGKVFHPPGSFIVDRQTINENSFTDGNNLSDVQNDVKNILKGKLVIVFGGRLDFHCLNIDPNELDIFDLQSVYYFIESGPKGIIKKEHSLPSVYSHYFKKDIRRRGVHSAAMGAKATMLVFRYGYLQDYENGVEAWPDGRNDIERIQESKKLSSKSLE